MTHLRSPLGFGSMRVRPPLTGPGQRIGLLGGSFNPPHDGHRQISVTALKRLGLDAVWWIVTPGNPLKSTGELATLASRMAEARGRVRHARIKVTDFEAGLPSAYTAATLAFLKRRHPGVCFVWLMGADNLVSIHRWRNWETIFRSMPIAVLDRPGWRLKGLVSKAARRFRAGFVPEAGAQRLASTRAPAWTFISLPLSPLSSTEIRRQRRTFLKARSGASVAATGELP
ncbi:MAG TPA: nicotinate-nucleotide adenylyltransferase [Hyphomicrobiaceae bacterium]|nr:nicotinate-nucleotide adenylyltransferase [Hyphomicrobiaceae bacterium]